MHTAIRFRRRLPSWVRPDNTGLGGRTRFALQLLIMVFVTLVLTSEPTSAQVPSPVLYPAIPPEKLADVILVLKPHVTHRLNVPAPVERIVQGDIMRLEKGVIPPTIVHTPNTLVSPLEAGVPVKLFLKAFKDRNAYYIIAVFPESYGGQP